MPLISVTYFVQKKTTNKILSSSCPKASADTVTMFFHIYRKLRSSDHGQLLLNLCFALMGLYLSFIASLHSRYVESLCLLFATLLQYFFLVTFIIMAAEAINLYMNLVIVLGRKIQHFVLKSAIVSWSEYM